LNSVINEKLDALRHQLEASEEEWKTRIVDALKKGYAKDGLDGLKLAAYELEAAGASKQMLASLLKTVARDAELDGKPVKSPSKNGLLLLGMYADDLRHGR